MSDSVQRRASAVSSRSVSQRPVPSWLSSHDDVIQYVPDERAAGRDWAWSNAYESSNDTIADVLGDLTGVRLSGLGVWS